MGTELDHINYRRVAHAISFLREHVNRQPELGEVADQVHLSPLHFQRIFSEWAGISPKRFLQYTTVEHLKSLLPAVDDLAAAAEQAGLSSQSRVYDLFTTIEAVTPQAYKRGGEGISIAYGFHPSPFGTCLIGVTTRGVCWLSFLTAAGDTQQALKEMTDHWHESTFVADVETTGDYVQRIFNPGVRSGKLHLLVKGTNFQLKVWQALLRIMPGELASYQSVAHAIGQPGASQAVGGAVGANHIAYLIPCHRVIRKDGQLGDYRWEAERKKMMVGWEVSRPAELRKVSFLAK